MPFDFPNSPTVNQTVTGPSGASYIWDGVKWKASNSGPGSNFQTPWLQDVDANHFKLLNVPTVSGDGNINLAAGGAGNLVLQTNAKTRLSVDSGGVVAINAIDGQNYSLLNMSGLQGVVQSPSSDLLLQATQGGLYVGVKNRISLQTTGTVQTERLSIDSAGHVFVSAPDNTTSGAFNVSGNVGIGTTSPGHKLDVIGGRLFVQPANEAFAIGMAYNAAGAYVWLGADSNNTFQISDQSGNARVNVTQAGNVGIGTTTPGGEAANAKLVVTGVAGQRASSLATSNTQALVSFRPDLNSGYTLAIGLESGGSGPYIQGVNWAGGSAAANLLLNPWGANVGIGTTAPAATLDVNGTIRAVGAPAIFGMPINTNAFDGSMPNNSISFHASSGNTTLIFRIRGGDGVMRQGSIAIS